MKCGKCDSHIPHGTAYVTLVKNIEQFEHDFTTSEDYVRVIHSEDFFTLCPECGNRLETGILTSIVKSLPIDRHGSREN